MSCEQKITGFDLYKIAIETRNLEIKLFWQRSLFFAALISSIFIGYARGTLDEYSKIFLAIFGILLSFAWGVANRGSKYWYESWESKVKDIEIKIGLNLFNEWIKPQGNFSLFSGRLYSASKISIFMSDLICLGWVVLLSKHMVNLIKFPVFDIIMQMPKCIIVFSIILIVLSLLMLLLLGARSEIPEDVACKWKEN